MATSILSYTHEEIMAITDANEGQIVYDTTNQKRMIYTNGEWVEYDGQV